MPDNIWQALGGNTPSLLSKFFSQSTARKPYQNFEQNFLSLITALSPHIAMSIERVTFNAPKEKDKLFKAYDGKSYDKIQTLNAQEEEANTLRKYILQLKNTVWTNKDSNIANIPYYAKLISSSPTTLIAPKHKKALTAFEYIVMRNLKNQAKYSKSLIRHLSFLKGVFGETLNIEPEVALADAQNLMKLITFYDELPSVQEKIKLMHELFLPLVLQEGEYTEIPLAVRPMHSIFQPLEAASSALPPAEDVENQKAFYSPKFFQRSSPNSIEEELLTLQNISVAEHYCSATLNA